MSFDDSVDARLVLLAARPEFDPDLYWLDRQRSVELLTAIEGDDAAEHRGRQ